MVDDPEQPKTLSVGKAIPADVSIVWCKRGLIVFAK
jgi:hypothetical protein